MDVAFRNGSRISKWAVQKSWETLWETWDGSRCPNARYGKRKRTPFARWPGPWKCSREQIFPTSSKHARDLEQTGLLTSNVPRIPGPAVSIPSLPKGLPRLSQPHCEMQNPSRMPGSDLEMRFLFRNAPCVSKCRLRSDRRNIFQNGICASEAFPMPPPFRNAFLNPKWFSISRFLFSF